MYHHKVIFADEKREPVHRFITDDNAVQLVINAMEEKKYRRVDLDINSDEIKIEIYDDNNVFKATHYIQKVKNIHRRILYAEHGASYDVGILSNDVKEYSFNYAFGIESFDEITLSDDTRYVVELVDNETGELVFVPEEHIYSFSSHIEEE